MDILLKRPRLFGDVIEDSDQEGVIDRENEANDDLAEMSRTRNEDMWRRKMDNYEKDGLSTIEAEENADVDVFMYRCVMVLSYILKLRGGLST